ncbi:theta class glutathione S-transferase [Hyaloscypha bicolor E]|uniref:Theta class glutathione S-transferase n=1 Tax=Hyaloscypha bicolor E TaxID=1095630 RepID=A0A2J6TVA4_9HELO|nr:theta class glutathione S-transferase [Hyaloscypha bicolor E]PMD66946.1 theta class glutathione S-transferase [Hyaloscypha bicolor E]
MSTPKTDISLYTAGTPNGQKISITLEELGIKYETTHIDISKNTQKEDWYLKINPNGRIPAIIDRTPTPEGKSREKRVFEGQAIMLYLCQKYDKDSKISFPFDTEKYWEVMEWMTWMQSGIGPMQGQANHFFRYAPQKIEYAIQRYQTETKRLYKVLEDRLAEQKGINKTAAGTKASTAGGDGGSGNGDGPWVVGDRYTIADIACFSWVNWAEWAGVDVAGFPEVKKWVDRINAREAVKRGLDVPEPFKMKEMMKTREGEEEYAQYHSSWVMKGQQKDQATHK